MNKVTVVARYLTTDRRRPITDGSLQMIPPVILPPENSIEPVDPHWDGDGQVKFDLFSDVTDLTYTYKENLAGVSRTLSVVVPANASGELYLASLSGWSAPSHVAVAGLVVLDAANDPALRATFVPVAPQFHGVRYAAYGHSFGQVQSPANAWAGSLYPARLRDLLHADATLYANRTQSGANMSQIATQAAATWIDGNGGLVTLLGNQNSVGNHVGEATFKSAVRSFITTIRGTTGTPPTLLVFKDVTCTPTGYARYGTPPTDADVAQYNTWLTEVIAEFPGGWIVVADPLADGWDPNTMTAPDGQHPNDRGMAHLAASGLRALALAPYRQGLNVGVVGPVLPLPPVAVADDFNRADSTTSLGTTTTGGKVWESLDAGAGAATWGISGNRAYCSATKPNGNVTIDAGVSDEVSVQVTLAALAEGGTDAGLLARFADVNNFWMLYIDPGSNYAVMRRTGGSYTSLTTGGAASPGDVLKITVSGMTLTFYVNGAQLHTVDDASFQTATRFGLRVSSGSGTASAIRFDGFALAPLA